MIYLLSQFPHQLPYLAKPLHSFFFSKECTLEHPHRLVSIHPVHLTRMAALFLSNQSKGPLKNRIALRAPTPLSSVLLWRLRDSGVIPGTGIPRNWLVVSASFHGSPLSKGGSLWAWCVCEVPVKRWLCVLRSWAHREQNSSVTPAELGLCNTADEREKWGEKTQKQHVWVLAQRHASVRSSGDWVTVGFPRGEVNRPVYTHLHQQTRVQPRGYKQTQGDICRSPNT